MGDTHPYVYVTRDDGATWRPIDRGLPLWAYVVREDPREPNLLFAGTEDGIYASFDAGAHWHDLLLGTHHVPVYDLQIQPDANDLIAGTHGRGFAILDDITPLEGLARAVRSRVALFAPRDAWRHVQRPYYDIGKNAFVAENKPYGATISYYLAPTPKPAHGAHAKEKIELEILHGATVIRRLHATDKAGINRVTWDLTTDPPGGTAAKQDPRPYYVFYSLRVTGPQVLPGTYTVRLIARGATLDAPVRVRLDPRSKATTEQLQAQYDALARLARDQERGERWLAEALAQHKRIGTRDPKLGAQLTGLANALRNGNGSENAGYQQPAQVIDQIAYLRHIMATSLTGPTQPQADEMARYERELDALAPRAKALFARAAAIKPTASPRPVRR